MNGEYMNRDLIETLEKEKNSLIPENSYLIAARGFGKTNIRMTIMLAYAGYCSVIEYLKACKEKYTLDKAHDLIREYVSEMWKVTENI